ncbi:hypothetical protein MCOR25_008461 [Pyricularia grisea]|uniref:Uncharacterized protein n=1 Tax=Pyricularia grisea TaxID=148305 RepID=A0A6P8AXE3_PYRGI|nr:hypothetical protein PgNI_10109 [Pyricularia grisea]KAI6354775.1 hypothetical protein MCOR25_008461 [Pyricularia grisea]TLD06964.1 hypothetical protein PgNI_10109 [Pyricularia grisea]
MQFKSFITSAVIASMASQVLVVAMPQSTAPAAQVFGCFVQMSVRTQDSKDETNISSGGYLLTTNPGQLVFTDGNNNITVKVDKDCQSAGISYHRSEVHFTALQKLSENGGPFEFDQPLIELQ